MGATGFNPSFYEILGVPYTATDDKIKQEYRKLSKLYHPDKSNNGSGDRAKFEEVTEAYETLRNPEKRGQYDQWLTQTEEDEEDPGFAPTGGPTPENVAASAASQQAAQAAAAARVRETQQREAKEAREATEAREREAQKRREEAARQRAQEPQKAQQQTEREAEAQQRIREEARAKAREAAEAKARNRLLAGVAAAAAIVLIMIIVASSGGSHAGPTNPAITTTTASAPTKTPQEVAAETARKEQKAIEARVAHLSFKCIERYVCKVDPAGHPLPLFVSGMDENLREYLEQDGYRDTWTDSAGGIEGQTIGPASQAGSYEPDLAYVSKVQEAGVPAGEDGNGSIESGMLFREQGEHENPVGSMGEGISPWDFTGSGVWTVTWTLRNASGDVVRRLRYSVRIVECGEATGTYCEKVGHYELNHNEPGNTNGRDYTTKFYKPPTPWPKSTSTTPDVEPTKEVYLGPIKGVKVRQLNGSSFKVTWENPHDPAVSGFLISDNTSEGLGTSSGFNTGIDPHASSVVDSISDWEPRYRPQPGQPWQFCVAPFGHWQGKGDYQEIPERQGCAKDIRWR